MDTDSDVHRLASDAFSRGEHGDRRAISDGLAALTAERSPVAQAWKAALAALLDSFEAATAPDAPIGAVEAFVDGPEPARRIAALAWALRARVRVSLFDCDGLVVLAQQQARLLAGTTDPVARLALDTSTLWLAIARGAGSPDAAQALLEQATALKHAPTVIEAMLQRTWMTLAAGQIAEAVALARRAFLMAQSEALPQLEWMASLVLARTRRYAGHPHFAVHILGALACVTSPSWYPWIAWELVLAGGEAQANELLLRPATSPLSPAREASSALVRVLAAARGGDRAAFESAAATVTASTRGFASIAYEADVTLAALDATRPATGDGERWRLGGTVHPPCGLHGIGAGTDPDEPGEHQDAVAYVIAEPGAKGRRVLRPGVGLAGRSCELQESEDTDLGGARTDTGLATLLLAGPEGLADDEFFKAVYGFAFVSGLHHGVLDVLIHRMRARLATAGTITRHGDPARLALRLERRVVVPDVRCASPLADRLLRFLAGRGITSAADAAGALSVSARTVQRALQQLVSDGACSLERVGRRVAYKIEDTVFTNLTSLSGRMRVD